MENSKKKFKFLCEVCRNTDIRVLWPSAKGWICIHCHWEHKIPIGIEEMGISEKMLKEKSIHIPYWKNIDEE